MGQRFRLFVGRHRRVDVRSEHERHAPVGHREVRIEPRGLREGAAGLGMVEAIGQAQALVHEQLGLLGLGRDLEDVFADLLQSRRASTGSGSSIELISGGLVVFVDRDLGMER